MAVPPDDEERIAQDWTSRARQWSRAAVALAVLFASLPLAGQLFLGGWRFDGAIGVAGLCLVAAAYLYFVGREGRPSHPDSAAILDAALRLAETGHVRRGISLLDSAIREDPGLWQAWQYRGEMHLGLDGGVASAVEDFTKAIRLTPDEPYLYVLRSRAFALLGNEAAAQADRETGARLGWDTAR